MASTLHLNDEALVTALRRVAKERGQPLDEFVAEVLRVALERLEIFHADYERLPEPVSLGGSYLADVDDISGILAKLEGEDRE